MGGRPGPEPGLRSLGSFSVRLRKSTSIRSSDIEADVTILGGQRGSKEEGRKATVRSDPKGRRRTPLSGLRFRREARDGPGPSSVGSSWGRPEARCARAAQTASARWSVDHPRAGFGTRERSLQHDPSLGAPRTGSHDAPSRHPRGVRPQRGRRSRRGRWDRAGRRGSIAVDRGAGAAVLGAGREPRTAARGDQARSGKGHQRRRRITSSRGRWPRARLGEGRSGAGCPAAITPIGAN